MPSSLQGTFISNPLWIAVFVGSGLCSGFLASRHGRSFWPWFLTGLLFGPLALLYTVVVFVFMQGRE